MITLLLHVSNSEPVKVDVEEMPNPSDIAIVCKNPRERSDKEVEWLDDGVQTVIIPWWRINYIQILPGDEDRDDFEKFYRD